MVAQTIVSASRACRGIIFLVAMGEALLIVGMIVPSTVVLAGAGALGWSRQTSVLACLPADSFGAVVGDAVSYWIGRVFKDRIRSM